MARIDVERAGRARTPGRGGAALVRHNERTKALSLEALRTTGGALRGTREGIGPVLDRWWCGFMAVLVVGLGLGWPLVSWISPVAQHGARLEPWWCASLALLFLGVGLAPRWSVPIGVREQTLRWFVGPPFGRRALRGIPRLCVLALASLGAVGTAVLALLGGGAAWGVLPAVLLGGGLVALAALAWLGLQSGASRLVRGLCLLAAAALMGVATLGSGFGGASGAAEGWRLFTPGPALIPGLSAASTAAVASGTGLTLILLGALLVPRLVDAADLRRVRQVVALRSAGMDAFEGMRLASLVPAVAPERRAARRLPSILGGGSANGRTLNPGRALSPSGAWWLLALRTWSRTLPGAVLILLATFCLAWWPTPWVTAAGSLAIAVGWGPWLLAARRAVQGPRYTFVGERRERATWWGIRAAWLLLAALAALGMLLAWALLPAGLAAGWVGAAGSPCGPQAWLGLGCAVIVAGVSRPWVMVPIQPPTWSGTPVPTPFGDVSVLRPLAWMARGLFPALALALLAAPWWPPLVAGGCALWLTARTRSLIRELD